MANVAGVPYGRLSFNLAITILHMRANTNLLCSKQLSFGGFVDVDLGKVGWRRDRNGEERPNRRVPRRQPGAGRTRLRTKWRSPWA